MRMILGAALLLTGCASAPKVTRFENLGFQVIEADPFTVDGACRVSSNTPLSDRGERIPLSSRIRCCLIRSQYDLDEIWISSRDKDCMVHELCHFDGRRSRAECAEIN